MNSTNIALIEILGYLSFLILSAALIYLAWKVAKKLNNYPKLDKNKWLLGLKIAALSYFIGFLFFRSISSYIDIYLINDSRFILSNLFSPLVYLEGMLTFLSLITLGIFNSIFTDNVSLFINVYLPGLILIFLVVQSLWMMINRREFLFIRAGIVAYAISIFFINAEAYLDEVNLKSNTINLSEIIEKNETLIFYRPVKFFNHDEGKLFKYVVDFKDGEFIIQNNTGKKFYLDPNRLDSNFNNGEFKSIITKIEQGKYDESLKGKINSVTGASEIIWPADFRCENKIIDENQPQKDDIPVVHVMNSGNCERLIYKGKTLIDSYINAVDLDFSDDKKWMIIVDGGGYDPENLYLINLSK